MVRKVHTIDSLLARADEYGECHLWTGYLGNGVPMVYSRGKMVSVRRLMMVIQGHEDKDGFYGVKCDCPTCVNPDHIQYRSQTQHLRKMNSKEFTLERKLRMTLSRRARPDMILTLDKVREIRAAEGSTREIGERYGISKSAVSKIRRGAYWPDTASPFAGLIR